jgi:cellulose synthase/poly-beta-1,6-N-acetylglucosamine synthase-like glycosyltransferase
MPPTSSSTVSNERVFRWWDYLLFGILTIASLVTIYFVLSHWFSVADWGVHPITCSLMTGILVIVLINNQGRWFLLPLMRKPRPMAPKARWKVAVVTTVVPSAEPIEMLCETVKAIMGMDYPHDTWVLDEEDDERVKALCRQLGAKHFSRKNLPQYQASTGAFRSGSKHGNYNAWLHEVGFEGYDILTAFDPDHVPQKSFLVALLGYFEDTRVGYVQAAQAYYNQDASFIARGAAEETYAYYSSVQMAGYGMGYPIIVGCHNTHRMTGLKQVGGFPAHDAEDLLLTLLYRTNDWQGVYVPEILARGLAPVDWNGYLRQQRRWARSVIDIKLRRSHLTVSNLSLKSRIMSFFHGINYLHKSALIFMALLLSGFMLATGRVPALVSYQTVQMLGFLCAMLQICEFYRQRFYLNPRKEWGFHWRVALLQYAKWPYFLMAFLDALFNKDKSYELTEKVKSKLAKRPLLWPNLLVIALLAEPLFAEWMLEVNVHPIVRLVVVALLVTSGVLVWTDWWRFPAPFDRAILGNSLLNEHETSAYKNPEWLLPDKQILREDGARAPMSHDPVSLFHAGQAALKLTDSGGDVPGTREESIGSKDRGLR